MRDGQGDAEDRVGTELGLVRGSVELKHREIDDPLLIRVVAEDFFADDVEYVLDRCQDSLAAEALATVTQLDGFESTRRGAGGDDGAAGCARVEDNLDLDGGVAARVEDFAGVDELNSCHGAALPWM